MAINSSSKVSLPLPNPLHVQELTPYIGIAYQRTPLDPLLDSSQCQRDASLMQKLGANTIRVYHVDPSGDHDGCMREFASAGIHLFVDLDTFDTQIEQDAPSWNQTQLSAFQAVFDAFQQYDNTAGVFVGNEVLTRANGSNAAPYVKAAVRDIKKYRDDKKYRKIPIGYSAADITELRPMLQNYLACGDDQSINAEFFSLNAYEWCGPSDYQTSGYSMLEQNATGYNIPIFLSETGCREPSPRLFDDQSSIFGSDMSDTWSGAIIYEWIEETNDYGLISYGPTVDPASNTDALEGYPRTGTPSPVSPDFSNLQNQWATLTPTGVKLSDYRASTGQLKPPACPTSTADGWVVNGNAELPRLGQSLAPQATASVTAAGNGMGSGASASASSTGGAMAGGRGSYQHGGNEIVGMGMGLMGVLLGVVVWL